MLQGLYSEDIYSLCYRVSMARIYILYVTGSLWQGYIYSMLQGLYGEDEIVTMETQIFILGVDLPMETGKLYFYRIIFYRILLFVKNINYNNNMLALFLPYTTLYYPVLPCTTLSAVFYPICPVLPYTTLYFPICRVLPCTSM